MTLGGIGTGRRNPGGLLLMRRGVPHGPRRFGYRCNAKEWEWKEEMEYMAR